jgi:hypothetical protein
MIDQKFVGFTDNPILPPERYFADHPAYGPEANEIIRLLLL